MIIRLEIDIDTNDNAVHISQHGACACQYDNTETCEQIANAVKDYLDTYCRKVIEK